MVNGMSQKGVSLSCPFVIPRQEPSLLSRRDSFFSLGEPLNVNDKLLNILQSRGRLITPYNAAEGMISFTGASVAGFLSLSLLNAFEMFRVHGNCLCRYPMPTFGVIKYEHSLEQRGVYNIRVRFSCDVFRISTGLPV